MKLFVILLVLVGGYYAMLMTTTNMALNQMKQLQNQYVTIAEQADSYTTSTQVSRQ